MEDRLLWSRMSELVESDSKEEEVVEIEERRKEEERSLVEVEEEAQRWEEVQTMSEGRRRK
jgi:hypothetical protein